MLRTMLAVTIAALIYGLVPATSQAAPIAPLSAGVTSNGSGLTQVRWHWHYHHWHHCWHCW